MREHPSDIRPPLALAKAALTLRDRANSESERKTLFTQAKEGFTRAITIDHDHPEVQALARALEQLRGKL